MGNINITDKAISKIQEVLSSQKMKYFRIFLNPNLLMARYINNGLNNTTYAKWHIS